MCIHFVLSVPDFWIVQLLNQFSFLYFYLQEQVMFLNTNFAKLKKNPRDKRCLSVIIIYKMCLDPLKHSNQRWISRVAPLEFILSTENLSWSISNFQSIYICSVTKNKISQPYAEKLGWLQVNNSKTVNKIICDSEKVARAPT